MLQCLKVARTRGSRRPTDHASTGAVHARHPSRRTARPLRRRRTLARRRPGRRNRSPPRGPTAALAARWRLGWWLLAGGAFEGFRAGTYLYATLRGKLEVWAREVGALHLTGAERVLDLGCGRGAMLLTVARRLTTGRAVGLDLWQAKDQSGNTEAAAWRNADVEGLADRVDLVTGDLRALPFDDASFDLVVSNLALHNVPDAADRVGALAEALRVLRPGTRLWRVSRAWIRSARYRDITSGRNGT